MKKMSALVLAVVLMLCVCTAAFAEEAAVTVTGSASVHAPTDHAVIQLGVRTRADTPSDAQAENNRLTDSVMKALTDVCGIASDKIATSAFSIYTVEEWVSSSEQEKITYQVMHTLSVTVDDIDKAGAVIDACVAAGANIVNSVSFESSSMQAAYDQALQEAIADAKHKAELIATAVGMKLGDIGTVSIGGSGNDFYNNSFRFTAEEAADGAVATKLAPGTQATSATVSVTWKLVKP